MKPIEKLNQIDRTFLGGEAGSFSEVPIRTISFWAEKGLIKADTSGTGDRRKFTALQVVEIAIIKEMSKDIKNLKVIEQTMDYLRRPGKLEKYLKHDHAFLIIPAIGEPRTMPKKPRILKSSSWSGIAWNDGDVIDDSVKSELFEIVFNDDASNTIVVNINRIANRVLKKL